MNKLYRNPYLNSICAEIYIIAVVWIMHRVSAPDTPDTFVDPIAAISLFVLSVAVMGYLFFGEPLQLYLDGEKERSVTFFMQTVVGFAAITAIMFIVVASETR